MAATPQELLSETPEAIWPGLMPCDFLPLISSGGGDWLCIHIDKDGSARKIVQWYHGGGDWIPWGDELAEALLFDAIRDRLPGPKRGHAIPAVQHSLAIDLGNDPYFLWAKKFLPAKVVKLVESELDSESLAEGLIDHQVSAVAVRCVLLEDALSEPLTQVLTPEVATNLQLPWNDVIEWTFDTDRVPNSVRASLAQKFSVDLSLSQDWEQASKLCKDVTQIAPSIAWAWDVLGYYHERKGNDSDAISCYESGSRASVFTDQSVRLQSHWVLEKAPKFSLARLLECSPSSIDGSEYLSLLREKNPSECRKTVTEHWLTAAQAAFQSGDFAKQYGCLFNAGWDLGAEPMAAYDEIIAKISQAASNAGFDGLSELAKTHAACLKQRYRF